MGRGAVGLRRGGEELEERGYRVGHGGISWLTPGSGERGFECMGSHNTRR